MQDHHRVSISGMRKELSGLEYSENINKLSLEKQGVASKFVSYQSDLSYKQITK